MRRNKVPVVIELFIFAAIYLWSQIIFLTCILIKLYPFQLIPLQGILAKYIVWRNFSILSPKLVLAYAEDSLSDSRLKNCVKFKSGWCKSVGVERFEIWNKKDFLGKKVQLVCYLGNAK